MDNLDKRILNYLQVHGFDSAQDLSDQLNTGERTVQRRLKNMRDQGVFKVIAVPNLVALGFQGWARIGLKVDPGQESRIAKILTAHPNVYLVTQTLGTYNMMIAAAFRTLEMLTYFAGFELNQIEGINSKEVILLARPIKYYHYFWQGFSLKKTALPEEEIETRGEYTPDELDLKILRILMADGLTRPATIKNRLSLSESTVRNRINYMKDNHLITLEAIPNKDVLESETQATIGIKTNLNFSNRSLEAIINSPDVYLVSASLGRYDLVIAVRFENMDQLSHFLGTQLGSIEGIDSVETALHYKSIQIQNSLKLNR